MADQNRRKPRRRPRQARSKVTVDAIVEATAQVFTSAGYDGTSTNYVAERAGVSIDESQEAVRAILEADGQ